MLAAHRQDLLLTALAGVLAATLLGYLVAQRGLRPVREIARTATTITANQLNERLLIADAPEERVLKLWEGLGYYSRARNLQKAAKILAGSHGGRFPDTVEAMMDLPGIGRYTAGAIASIAFDRPSPILDGNVVRVLTRIFALPGDPKGKELNGRLWQLAEALVLNPQQPRVNHQKHRKRAARELPIRRRPVKDVADQVAVDQVAVGRVAVGRGERAVAEFHRPDSGVSAAGGWRATEHTASRWLWMARISSRIL